MSIGKSVVARILGTALALGLYANTSEAEEECAFSVPTPVNGRPCGTGAEDTARVTVSELGGGTQYRYSVEFVAGTEGALAGLFDEDRNVVIDDESGLECFVETQILGDTATDVCNTNFAFEVVEVIVVVN
jgi:hypothetical protein